MSRPRKPPKQVWVEMLEEEMEKHYPRAVHGATQIPKMCARLGCSVAAYYQWRTKTRTPARKFWLPLSEFLGVPVERLLVLLSEGEVDVTKEGRA